MKLRLALMLTLAVPILASGATVSVDNAPLGGTNEITPIADNAGNPLTNGVAAVGFFTQSTYTSDEVRGNFSILGQQSFSAIFPGFISLVVDLGPITEQQARQNLFLVLGDGNTVMASNGLIVLSTRLVIEPDIDSPVPSAGSLQIDSLLESETLHLGNLVAIPPTSIGPFVATEALLTPPATPSFFVPIIVPEPSVALMLVLSVPLLVRRNRIDALQDEQDVVANRAERF